MSAIASFDSLYNSIIATNWQEWLLENSSDRGRLLNLLRTQYYTLDPLVSATVITFGIAIICWVLAVLANNHSQVDRLWSITPVLFSWHFALHSFITESNELSVRGVIMSVLSTLWGIRLTYNFARKGGYKWSNEDYRWSYVKKGIPRPFFEILNVVFISLYQNFLLMSLTLPVYLVCSIGGDGPLNWIDVVAGVSFSLFFVGETIADQQQWKFQNEKHIIIKAAAKNTNGPKLYDGDLGLGYLTHGLFRYSRHPHYFCEMGLWWSYYLFGVAATLQPNTWIQALWFNWTMVGAVNLTLLFQGSTLLTEKISMGKYPSYCKYRKITSRFIPWFPGEDISPGKEKTK
ncbi:4074_t:CDS:2 [Paraglomus occultum]|uniref:4074_t:CDS:1 n=1 Tax=Paraglomus occultum TaxID=144539 RepID=A0A9N9AQL9_9GLOM|nr:4074_t:CDS:2 [Paraglomus occultum]